MDRIANTPQHISRANGVDEIRTAIAIAFGEAPDHAGSEST